MSRAGAPLRTCPVCGWRGTVDVIAAHVGSDHPEVPAWVREASTGGCSAYVEDELEAFMDSCGGLVSLQETALVADDERTFPWRAIYARSSLEAICLLAAVRDSGESLQQIWLDHDLGPDRLGAEDDGMRVVEWMVGWCPTTTPVVVHSDSKERASAMEQALRSGGFRVRRADAKAEGAYQDGSAPLPLGLWPPAHAR